MNYALMGDGAIVNISSYALVEDGVVTNIAWIRPENAAEFPGAVNISGRPVAIGDAYENGVFLRDGVPVLTTEEELAEANAALAEIEEALHA